MIQESLTDDLTDTELLKRCIMSLSDTILYTDIKKKETAGDWPAVRNAPGIGPQEHKENRGISAFII